MSDPILVATDLSPAADEALRQAHARARLLGAPLVVVHALPDLISTDVLFPELGADLALATKNLPGRVRELLEQRLREETGRDPGEYEVVVEKGKPATVIQAQAERTGASLIVVGSLGGGGVATVLLGSVSERVVRQARTPVLVARPSPADGPVVAGTDFSDPTYPALAAARTEGARRGARVIFSHCLELGALVAAPSTEGIFPLPPDTVPSLERTSHLRLEQAARELGADSAERQIGIGEPGAFLVELAAKVTASLVVVGTHGRTGLARFFLGSVAQRVVRHAPCSVLVVRLAG